MGEVSKATTAQLMESQLAVSGTAQYTTLNFNTAHETLTCEALLAQSF